MKKLGNQLLKQTDTTTRYHRGLLSIGKAANYLRVSVDTLRNWETTGKIQPIRSEGGIRRYNSSQLRKLVKARQKKSAIWSRAQKHDPLN